MNVAKDTRSKAVPVVYVTLGNISIVELNICVTAIVPIIGMIASQVAKNANTRPEKTNTDVNYEGENLK